MVRRCHQTSKQIRGTENVKTPWCCQNYVLVGGEIFRTSPGRPWEPPSLLYNGYRSLSRGWSSRDVALTTHPPTSSAEVKERVELYLKLLSVTSWPVLGWTFSFTFYTNSSRKNEARCRRRRDDITELILNQQDLVLWVTVGIIEHTSDSSCCIKSGEF